ncbi:MAG: NAD(P)-dependent oxidoreductase [Bacteroidetes bacterium]|nr:MAG: NAD(P)-dependent oxidoreductase [Bacteroidota bacterium]
MRVFVTGATGFIGSHISDVFHKNGIIVRCGIREKSNLQWLKDKPFELVKYSLDDLKSLSNALEDVDYVIHCGGTISANKQEDFFHINTQGTIKLLEAAKEYSNQIKRFIYISSQTAAGPARALAEPVKEADETKPITTYAKSKRKAEEAVLKYGMHFPVTILRPSAVVGPRDYAIFPIFKSIKNRLAILIGFKPKYLNLIHSSDLAEATYLASMNENTIGKIYFIAAEKPVTWNEVMKILKNELNIRFTINIKFPHFVVLSAAYTFQQFRRLIGNPHPFNLDKGRDFIQKYWICSIDNAKKDFGFSPKLDAREAVIDTLKWYIENKWM